MPCGHDDSPAATDRPDQTWPPKVGEPLPRAAKAFGVHDKLAGYSLDVDHPDGGPKAKGFETILGITIDDIDYLEAKILDAVQTIPIGSVRPNPPWGSKCVIDIPVAGLREKRDRVVNVRTVWEIVAGGAPPRLVNAYPKP